MLYKPSTEQAGLAVRFGMGLAVPGALVLLLALSGTQLRAESPAGLIISGNGDHVNVSLDSQAGSDISIRRSDDVMMIKVPSSFSAKLVIDPKLKKDNVVQEAETSGGKMITINSQQIYLITQENLKDSGASAKPGKPNATAPAKAAAAKPASMSTPPATEANAGMHAAVDTREDAKGATVTESGVKPVALTEAAKPAPTRQSVQSGKPASNLSIASIPSIVPRSGTEQKSAKPAHTTSQKEKSTAAKASAKSAAHEDDATEQTPFSRVNVVADPEAQPLDLSGKQQALATKEASYTMFRIVLSLLVVLSLLLGFVRVLLPKLMARYPDFFERLRQHYQQQQAGINRGPFFKPSATPSEPVAATPIIPQEPPPAPKATHAQTAIPATEPPPPIPPSQPAKTAKSAKSEETAAPATSPAAPQSQPGTALSRLSADKQMTVLGSTALGDGKEIHLVEVQGKQLVIATTPSTVSFLTDLTGVLENDGDEADDESGEDVNQSRPQSSLSNSNTPNVIAYLSDETAEAADPDESSSSPAKPYASTSHTAHHATVSPTEQVYRKYLQPPSYVDAEEVIVLEDYDDVYGY